MNCLDSDWKRFLGGVRNNRGKDNLATWCGVLVMELVFRERGAHAGDVTKTGPAPRFPEGPIKTHSSRTSEEVGVQPAGV
jgi:hypothetical protein